jgi:hypothetical protein
MFQSFQMFDSRLRPPASAREERDGGWNHWNSLGELMTIRIGLIGLGTGFQTIFSS